MQFNDESMRVLLVSPFSDKLVGGIINWTKYIVNYHRGHHSDIDLTLLYNENASQVMDAATPLSRFRAGIVNYLPVVRQFIGKVSGDCFDVVHICTSASFGLIRDLIIVQVAKKRGVKTIAHMHFGRIPQVLKSKGWERTLLLRLFKTVDYVAVMDKASFDVLNAYGLHHVRYVPNPLSEEVKRVIEECGDIPKDPRKIVFAGHVLPTKGVEELVRACSQIENVKLKLLGKVPDESFRRHLFAIAGQEADKWLSIPGNRPFDTVIAEMKSCGAFVLPSYFEGFPNVILESMACGIPIVATSVGAIPEMLAIGTKEPCGICIEPKDVEALKMAILEILGKEEEAIRMAANAQRRVNEMYAMPKVWSQLVDLWHDASDCNKSRM